MAFQYITIDGTQYPNIIVTDITRKFTVLDGENTSRSIHDGAMVRDIIGTFYNYSITFDTRKADYQTYDALYELLSAPVASHSFVLPYAQTTRTFEGYVTSGDDNITVRKVNGTPRNIWGELTIEIIAMEAARI